MIQWIIDNKDWVFSGIGVTVVTIFLSLFLKHKRKDVTKIDNIQIGGSNSTNYQSKGDMYFGESNDKKRK